jgi:benzoyl-CoA reductase/2-hydroxyglutaryl-CoA dehydratase subunit BcrC/BadD/HgdB
MKTVAYSCPFVPPEWIAAHGLRPRLLVGSALAAGVDAGPAAGACAFARGVAHEAMAAQGIDAYIATSLCDQRRRATELAARHGRVSVFQMHVPATHLTGTTWRAYVDELERLGRFLVRLGGRKPDGPELVWHMRLYAKARADLRRQAGGLSARQFTEAYWNLAENVFEAGEAGLMPTDPPPPARPLAKGETPIMLLGGPLMREGLALLDAIERCGGRIVLNATENGPAIAPAPFRLQRVNLSPMPELARAYFQHIPHPFSRPNHRLYEWLAATLKSSQARGIVFIRYVWCDLWHAELARLKEFSPVPVVDVDLAAGDDAAARTATRAAALLEMLA